MPSPSQFFPQNKRGNSALASSENTIPAGGVFVSIPQSRYSPTIQIASDPDRREDDTRFPETVTLS